MWPLFDFSYENARGYIEPSTEIVANHRRGNQRIAKDVKTASPRDSQYLHPYAVIDIEEAHESARSLKGTDARFEACKIPARRSNRLPEFIAGDRARCRFKGGDDGVVALVTLIFEMNQGALGLVVGPLKTALRARAARRSHVMNPMPSSPAMRGVSSASK